MGLLAIGVAKKTWVKQSDIGGKDLRSVATSTSVHCLRFHCRRAGTPEHQRSGLRSRKVCGTNLNCETPALVACL